MPLRICNSDVTFAPVSYQRFWNTDTNVILLNTLYSYKLSYKEVSLFMILEMFSKFHLLLYFQQGAKHCTRDK